MTTPETVTWEQALDFTLLEQRVGALPWHIAPDVMLRMREQLAPSYREHHDQWPLVRNKVLRIARYHGAVAALIQEIVDGPAPSPGFVSFESLQIAFWIVQLACPTGEDPNVLRGKHCQIPALQGLDRKLIERLRSLAEASASPQEWSALLG